jgi:signal transduction histidine kinase
VGDRDGAIFAIPASINLQSRLFTRAVSTCRYTPDVTGFAAREGHLRTHVREQLLIQSGIALAGMSLLSLGLGWLMAGRVLQPLEDSYRAQRQFVANASHELRAPLTRLRALSDVALASPEASFDSLRRAHERVLASEQHLEQLIDGLLALSRGQAGLERRDRVDLAALTSQAMLALGSQQEVEVRSTLATARTAGDPRLLERLIANLIDNAIRHNTPGGHVEITTGTRDRHAFLAIDNTGRAIPAEEVERLFEPFQRLEGARTRHDGGHGLGLSIVRAIADAHQAELAARPRADGGLTIEVAFPAATVGGSGLALRTARWKRSRLARAPEK